MLDELNPGWLRGVYVNMDQAEEKINDTAASASHEITKWIHNLKENQVF